MPRKGPRKGKGQRIKGNNDVDTPQNTVGNPDRSDFRNVSPIRNNGVERRGKGKARATKTESDAVPNVFRDMLSEALPPLNFNELERPRKKRRTRPPEVDSLTASFTAHVDQPESHGDDDDALEFEDVLSKTDQTAFNDVGSSSEETDIAWEEVGIKDYELKSDEADEQDGLDLTLRAENSTQPKSSATRRRAVGKAERTFRLSIHKMHILCLLSHIDKRNTWCNDSLVQSALKPLVTKQMLGYLQPNQSYTQFRRTESVKRGLTLAIEMWISKFNITKRGMRRSFWTEREKDLENLKPSPDADSLHQKTDFLVVVKELKGSRDLGTQLFCALLRGIGLDVRLVCSLQPLPFSANASVPAPGLLQESSTVANESTPDGREDEKTMSSPSNKSLLINGKHHTSETAFPVRRRLGHPNAANYFMPQIAAAQRPSPKRNEILESPYPVFWVEVLDEAHQKWMAVNPMDSTSVANSRKFEPPASDPENNLSYVVAFEDDGAAKDVTRRYTKNFNAKTRKNRVESSDGGEKWWRKTRQFHSRGWKSDLDQIEDIELAAAEAREPMPKKVSDFKDHPFYALERHLRRSEALVNATEVGRLATGRDGVGGKKVEKVFRRSDVKTVKSADGWYRIGREVKLGEQPVKVVAGRAKTEEADEENESAGTALYTEAQTELYEPPPIVNGRVPRNSYGNLDIYVPSMVPSGGVHIPHSEASRAARLLGIDFADAITGFTFRGRHGTAIIRGIVIAIEYHDALNAVIEGFLDEHAQAEEERRSTAALRMWRLFLVSLRIKERVDGYEIEVNEMDRKEEEIKDTVVDSDSGMESEEYIDDGGGGFFPE